MPVLTTDEKHFAYSCPWCGKMGQTLIGLDIVKDLLKEHETACRARSATRETARARYFLEEHRYDYADEDVYDLAELLHDEQRRGWSACRGQMILAAKRFAAALARGHHSPNPKEHKE